MIRGVTLFKCTECGKTFLATDIEYMGTSMSAPQPCPRCHSMRTRPTSLLGAASNSVYEAIWKKMKK